MPDFTLPIFGGVFGVLWILVLVHFLFRARQVEKKEAVRLAALALAFHVNALAMMLSLVLQGGLFEAATFFSFTFFTLLAFLIATVTRMMIQFTHGYNVDLNKKLQRNLRIVLGVGSVAFGAVVISAMVMTRTTTADLTTLILMECALFLVCAVFALNLKFMSDFFAVLEGSTVKLEVRERLRRRLQRLIFYWGGFIAVLLTVAVASPAVLFSLGSFPFLWVFYLPGLICANFVTVGVSVFFKSELDAGVNSSKQNSKQSKNGDVMSNPMIAKEGEII
jgi:hypothetical protein